MLSKTQGIVFIPKTICSHRSSKSSVASDASQAQQPAELEEDRKGGKKKGSKKDKDKGSGIFKGLGHMFRYKIFLLDFDAPICLLVPTGQHFRQNWPSTSKITEFVVHGCFISLKGLGSIEERARRREASRATRRASDQRTRGRRRGSVPGARREETGGARRAKPRGWRAKSMKSEILSGNSHFVSTKAMSSSIRHFVTRSFCGPTFTGLDDVSFGWPQMKRKKE